MKALISVIVPVYKVEPFLKRCVKSIQQQTYQNIEIILVDDGSPDACPDICDEFAIQDSRIRVIHKKNGGLSCARNAGIAMASGEYFCFVDSDDFIHSTMLEHLLASVNATGAKLAIANVKTVDEDGRQVIESKKSPICTGCFTAQELLPKLYQEFGWYYIVAWNKLYHRSLFEKIQFPVGKIHEDEYVIAQIIWKAQKVVCISNEEYVYTYQRKGGIMNSRQIQSQINWLEALYLRFKFCKNKEGLESFVKETRAVYFRELNNLYLMPNLLDDTTYIQRRIVKQHYSQMEGKTRNERFNWLLFQINPKLDYVLVQKIRKLKG